MKTVEKIIEEFETDLLDSWMNWNNINYDLLSEARMKCWNQLKQLN